ncbi:MAG: threonine synthase [Solirubrobacteraceae bacterium]
MITLGEGHTPLVELPRLARELGVEALHAKLESCNPTGSYKDRIAARSIDLALAQGNKGWIATSSGNGAMAFAAYGRRAGLPGILCVTETITREKLLPILTLGANVVRIAGLGNGGARSDERELMDAVMLAAAEHALYVGITAHCFNDAGMRAVDAISHEIVQAGRPADLAYVPVGGGGLVAAVARGMLDAGASTAVVAVQPAGCAPIARYIEGEIPAPTIERAESAISGLQVPSAPDGELAAELVRKTGGWAVTASDEQILAAQRALALREGVFVEPAAACALAGLQRDLDTGRVDVGSSALLILTGAGLKDLATLEQWLEPAPIAAVEDLPQLITRWVA